MKYKFLILTIVLIIFSFRVGDSQPADEKTYTVIKGDCLWKISQINFFSGKFWPEIWVINKEGVVNKDKIQNTKRKTISNPNLIYPGQVLNIPKVRTLNKEQLNSAYKEARKKWKELRKNKAKTENSTTENDTEQQPKK